MYPSQQQQQIREPFLENGGGGGTNGGAFIIPQPYSSIQIPEHAENSCANILPVRITHRECFMLILCLGGIYLVNTIMNIVQVFPIVEKNSTMTMFQG